MPRNGSQLGLGRNRQLQRVGIQGLVVSSCVAYGGQFVLDNVQQRTSEIYLVEQNLFLVRDARYQ